MTSVVRRLLTWTLLSLATFAAICAVLALILRPTRPAAAEAFTSARHARGALPKLWRSPRFSLIDQHGAPVTDGSLDGKPYIADFIFTECTSACPMMTAKMVQLQRRLVGADVRFVSFSVDPAHDTPRALAAYATRWSPSESRWSLLATTPDSLARVMEGFRVTAKATKDPLSPIVHSTLFFLVDADGNVRAVYDSDDARSLDTLVADAASLATTRAPPTENRTLYASLGCAGCHDNPQIAPSLVNLHGTRRLEGGASVTVDDTYVRASILDPARDRVAGYSVRMPSYRGILTDAQVGALVAELRGRSSDAGPEQQDVRIVTDPVCHMKVRVEPGVVHATAHGAEYYFCSETCRDAFLKDTKRYLVGAPP